jgi:hypothetical protein
MKHILLLLILSAPVMAQDFIHEGMRGYDATTKPITPPAPLQSATATFTFTRKSDAANQQAADRKLAAYLAAYAESKGKSGMCEVGNNGACRRNQQNEIVYDLSLVSAAIEAILTSEIDGAARERFKAAKLDDARKKADEDFDKEEKPTKTAAPRSVPRRRQ